MNGLFAATIAVSLAASFAPSLQAETLNYYYVGAAPKISNIKEPLEKSILSLGYLRIDTSRIPSGMDANNFSIEYYDGDSTSGLLPEAIDFSLIDYFDKNGPGCCFNGGIETTVLSVKDGRITDWFLSTNTNGGIVTGFLSSSRFGDRVTQYNKGAADGFEAQTLYATDAPGEWFRDDELDLYSVAILNNTRYSLLNPPVFNPLNSKYDFPSDYPDVTPVPIPASVLFLAAAMGILAKVGFRRKTATAA